MNDENSLAEFLHKCKTNPREIFKIIEKIGEGTYAQVYKAINLVNDQIVAIKISPRHTDDEKAFITEIDTLRNIDFPHIIKMIDVYITNEEMWIILEYCHLGSIHDIIVYTKETFTEAEISYICYNVLQALMFIHSRNQIHRDVKPGNILINQAGQIKLTDFGVLSKRSLSNTFIGTLLWMAPEQFDEKVTYNSSIDIWALGICVIEMAEGYAPFSHLHNVRAKYCVQNKPQTSFSNPDLFSSELKDFLSKCLQIDFKKRSTARELSIHPFIVKHKYERFSIGKNFVKQKMPKIEEFRMNVLTGNENNFSLIKDSSIQNQKIIHEEVVNLTNIFGDALSPVGHRDHTEKSENLTCIEKSNVELSSIEVFKNAENLVKESFEDHMAAAINYIKAQESIPENLNNQEGLDKKESLTSLSIEETGKENVKNESEYTKESVKSETIGFENEFKRMSTQSILFGASCDLKNDLSIIKLPPKSSKIVEASPALVKQKKKKVLSSKSYKSVNESNFQVKHAYSRYTMVSEPHISFMSESVMPPVSEYGVEDKSEVILDSTREILSSLEKEKRRPINHSKVLTSSTADSKGEQAFYNFSSNSDQNMDKNNGILKIIKENISFSSQASSMRSYDQIKDSS